MDCDQTFFQILCKADDIKKFFLFKHYLLDSLQVFPDHKPNKNMQFNFLKNNLINACTFIAM